jgi:hypothetical protein
LKYRSRTSLLKSLFVLHESREVLFELERDLETIVHVGRLLEATRTLETFGLIRVTRSCNPSDTMIGIVGLSLGGLSGFDDLHTVVADHDAGSATLTSIRLHSLFDRLARGGTMEESDVTRASGSGAYMVSLSDSL